MTDARGDVSKAGESGGAGTRAVLAVGGVAASVAFAAVAAYSWVAATSVVVGGVAVVAGGVRGRPSAVRVGAGALAVSVLVAGLEGAPPLAVGVGAWSALVAWDATTYALDVADQVGSATDRGVALRRVRAAVLVGAAGLAAGGFAFLAAAASGTAAVAGAAALAGVALVLALA